MNKIDDLSINFIAFYSFQQKLNMSQVRSGQQAREVGYSGTQQVYTQGGQQVYTTQGG